jgi:hypothetical protein
MFQCFAVRLSRKRVRHGSRAILWNTAFTPWHINRALCRLAIAHAQQVHVPPRFLRRRHRVGLGASAWPFRHRWSFPGRPRRRRPQHPGIRNAPSASLPSRKDCTTSPTGPQIWEITSMPLERRANSKGQEIAPQMSTLTASSATCRARRVGSWLVNAISRRSFSAAPATSINRRFAATSKTGDTRPCH